MSAQAELDPKALPSARASRGEWASRGEKHEPDEKKDEEDDSKWMQSSMESVKGVLA